MSYASTNVRYVYTYGAASSAAPRHQRGGGGRSREIQALHYTLQLRVPVAVGRVHTDSNRIITDDFYAN